MKLVHERFQQMDAALAEEEDPFAPAPEDPSVQELPSSPKPRGGKTGTSRNEHADGGARSKAQV